MMPILHCRQECRKQRASLQTNWGRRVRAFLLFHVQFVCGGHPKLQTRWLWALLLCCTIIVHFPQGVRPRSLCRSLALRLLKAEAALRHSDTSPKPLTYRFAAAGAWRIKPGTPGLLRRRLTTLSFARAEWRITGGPLPPVISALWSWRLWFWIGSDEGWVVGERGGKKKVGELRIVWIRDWCSPPFSIFSSNLTYCCRRANPL